MLEFSIQNFPPARHLTSMRWNSQKKSNGTIDVDWKKGKIKKCLNFFQPSYPSKAQHQTSFLGMLFWHATNVVHKTTNFLYLCSNQTVISYNYSQIPSLQTVWEKYFFVGTTRKIRNRTNYEPFQYLSHHVPQTPTFPSKKGLNKKSKVADSQPNDSSFLSPTFFGGKNMWRKRNFRGFKNPLIIKQHA